MQAGAVHTWQKVGGVLGKPDTIAGMRLANLAAGRRVLGTHGVRAGGCWAILATGRQLLGKHGNRAGMCSVNLTNMQAGGWQRLTS